VGYLFDWLVNGQVVPANPAASVRGPRHVVRSGKSSAREPAEARRLLDSIDATTSAGLRDRALISLMVYSFARIGAALEMKIVDVITKNRKLWLGGCSGNGDLSTFRKTQPHQINAGH
jgi:integrase/recombinase XerC